MGRFWKTTVGIIACIILSPPLSSAQIPGIAAVDVHGNLTRIGFTLTKDLGGRRGSSWTCRSVESGCQVEVVAKGPWAHQITIIAATVDWTGGRPKPDVAKKILGYIASLPYEGSTPAATTEWVTQNINGNKAAVIAGQKIVYAETVVGGVVLRITVLPNGRALSIFKSSNSGVQNGVSPQAKKPIEPESVTDTSMERGTPSGINASDWAVHIWSKHANRWEQRPLATLDAQVENEALKVKNTSSVHRFAKVVYRKKLEGNFKVNASISGSFGLNIHQTTGENGQGFSLPNLYADSPAKFTVTRADQKLTILENGVGRVPSVGTGTNPLGEMHFCIVLQAGESCEISGFEAVATQPLSVMTRRLGTVAGKDMESKPAQVLYQMLSDNPGSTVYLVTLKVALNERMTDYTKCFYDKSRKILVEMTRTEVRGASTVYAWTIWHDVLPLHFKDKLPFSNLNLRSTLSSDLKSEKLPLEYPDNPELLKWY